MLDSYLIKNGTLVSILDGRERKADILVERGIIADIREEIEAPAAEVIDASGMYITIGWLDSHCHFTAIGDRVSLDPVNDLIRQGVTYALDLGTSGPANYEDFRAPLLYRTDLRFHPYLYIGTYGARGSLGRGMDFESPEDIQPEKVKAVAEKYRHELVGLKARIDDKFCFDPDYVMKQLRALGDELDMPIAVHAPRSRIGIDNLLPYLKKGDVLCHTLAGNSDVMKVIDENGNIKQKTEDLVGPYELHDFFLYYFLRFGFRPAKIYMLAKKAFIDSELERVKISDNDPDCYDEETIKKWLKTFVRRFFNQQFKRSCLPDGPKVGSVSLSPRGDWRMPSDAASTIWLQEAENL